MALKIVKLFGKKCSDLEINIILLISIEFDTPPKPKSPVLIHLWLSTISVFVIRGAWGCVLCVTRDGPR